MGVRVRLEYLSFVSWGSKNDEFVRSPISHMDVTSNMSPVNSTCQEKKLPWDTWYNFLFHVYFFIL